VKASVAIDQARSGEDVEMRMEVQIIAKGLHGGDGGELSIRQIEPPERGRQTKIDIWH